MAANDGVNVTPGTGVVVASQLVSGKEYQVIVLSDQSGNLDPIARNKPAIPAVADILCGSANAGPSSTTAVTVITIPAGRTWAGNVGVECVNTANVNAGRTRAMIQVNGTGVTPAAGTNLCVAVTHPGGTSAPSADANVPITYVVAPVGNSVTIQVKLDTSDANFEATGFANGILL